MNQSRRSIPSLAVSLLFFISCLSAAAQTDSVSQGVEPSYEISLQILIGSNDATARGIDLPANLSGISRQLKDNFSFSRYRLANTFLGRISNNGNIEYRSVSNLLGQEAGLDPQTFLDWSVIGLKRTENRFHAKAFRFGARIPVRTGALKDESGKVNPVVNYEPVGLSMTMIGLPTNKPTLVGTIGLPRETGTIFVVATIKPADM